MEQYYPELRFNIYCLLLRRGRLGICGIWGFGLRRYDFLKSMVFAWQLTKFAKPSKSADTVEKNCFSIKGMLISRIERY
jgi:hypothetical protein